MKKRIRTLIVDDHAITRTGIVSLLGTEDDFEVVGEAADGRAAVREARRTNPDVIVMDLMMPEMDGCEATKAILEMCPATHILILTTFGDADSIGHALAAGAAGAIMKNTDTDAFVDILRDLAAGKTVIAPEIRKMLTESPPVPLLTNRQQEILLAITQGLSNKDIAERLDITADCVKDHVNVILAKIGANNRTEAVAIALRKHLLKA